MAQSTEDYLDSLLRQAMGIPDPEPVAKPEVTPDLGREDVLAMADGLTGSNSAILGHAYDHNASFTNQGEIEIHNEQVSMTQPDTAASSETSVPTVAPEDMPDPDAPVAVSVTSDAPVFTESILPEIKEEPEPVAVPEPEPIPETVPAEESIVIPDGPVIEQDTNELDIIPGPAPLDIPVSVEEPVIEEPVALEPAIEEPAIEEPVAEEPAPSVSIDDLDSNDAAKALDADTIAALFESANAEPAQVEEPAIEETAIEEPATEEPVTEEPAAEEPAADNGSENLSAEEIAALIAGANGETASEDETAAVEDDFGNDESSLEELDMLLGEDGDVPLMPDQEITDLLSNLGELSGENNERSLEEDSAGQSDTADEESDASDAGDVSSSDTKVGGLDLFDTDLSAMLDDVTNSLDSDAGDGDGSIVSDDADLNELLGSLDDGSGELSDIGDLLNKDENSELVDPNTETAEALFASDSEDQIFDIDNPIEEEEPKRKKKKFSLFGKKKKNDNIEVIGGEEEMLIDPDLLDIPDESELKKKKPGFFANLLAKLFEEADEGDEAASSGIEQSAVDIAAEGAAENESILSELEAEEALGKKDKKEKKKKEKKEKKGKKGKKGDAEPEDGEEVAEEPKKKKKKEKKKKEKLPDLPTKKLPRKKVVAIALFCITIGIVITILAFFIPYSQDIEKAKKFYTTGEYQKTYEYMRGHKLTSEDQILYDRTTTLLRIKRPYDSYQNYMKMGLRIEALNALVQGVQMIDRYAEDAASLGIIDKYSKLSRMIYDELYNTFGVTVDRARGWIELEGTPEYTRALYDCLIESSGIKDTTDNDYDQSYDMFVEEDPIINAEENDL